MTLDMTKEESDVLLQILDGYTKAYGLNGAEACLVFGKRIVEAQKEPEKKE